MVYLKSNKFFSILDINDIKPDLESSGLENFKNLFNHPMHRKYAVPKKDNFWSLGAPNLKLSISETKDQHIRHQLDETNRMMYSYPKKYVKQSKLPNKILC